MSLSAQCGGAEIQKAVLKGNNGSATVLNLSTFCCPILSSNRLQGLMANENMIQRTVFFSDGMKLFRNNPVFGNGMGSFESLVCGYQDFYYETKYFHNNYIQVLLDNGIIGFIAYAAILLGTLYCL
jgi:O-antigen ligase